MATKVSDKAKTTNTTLSEPDREKRSFLKLAATAALAPGGLVGCGSGSIGSDLADALPLSYSQTIATSRAAIAKAMADSGTPSVSVALIERDRVIWSEAFGMIDKANNTPATTSTLFGIGSVSKMFAAIATMMLVERGLLQLDAPLVRYLPGFVMASAGYSQITVRMLLSHSSGFPGTEYRGAFSLSSLPGHADQTMRSLSVARLKHAPGEMSVYCNDGFTMIEPLVAAVTGRTYAQFVTQEILVPLGMTRSRFGLMPFAPGSFAPGYEGDIKLPQEFTNIYATGGLCSTPAEMGQIARMLLNGGVVNGVRILQAESVAEMGRDQTLDQPRRPVIMTDGLGLGWDGVRQGGLDAVGIRAWHKSGGTLLYTSDFYVLPDEGLALMITGASLNYGAGPLIERILLNALVERRTIPALPRPLASTPGVVVNPTQAQINELIGIFAFGMGVVQLQVGANRTLSLRAWAKDGWAVAATELKLRSDGLFSSDAQPTVAYRAAKSLGQSYLVQRQVLGHWMVELPHAQKMAAKTPLSAVWKARIGRRWLAVNEPAESMFISSAVADLSVTLTAIPELPGYVLVNSNYQDNQIVDASTSDSRAVMCLKIPVNNGRDLDDVIIDLKFGEEWLSSGGIVYRPAQSVPVLVDGTSQVRIGDEGYAEWRAVPAQRLLSTSGASAWKSFDANLKLVAQGSGDAVARSAAADSRLLLYGTARSTIRVTLA